ncbi:hypothetical protein [Vreelandella venusta]|uniref:hypothetical protein n=1 Tax=Vreelandella venusta TaxID=44935 RepID=UPI00200BFA66|nr:hypothetical protein [Halomonas venusta]MBR9923693.1 hypothetical protein [Gammaproteobacteria bacterium]UQI42486.1 hypothetical protein M3L73_09570 [Halomonas venusta]
MKNKIDDLRNHLFAQLERLGDESIKGDALKEEIQRARAVSDVSAQIVDTARAENERLKLLKRAPGSDFVPAGEIINEEGLPALGGGQ